MEKELKEMLMKSGNLLDFFAYLCTKLQGLHALLITASGSLPHGLVVDGALISSSAHSLFESVMIVLEINTMLHCLPVNLGGF